MTAATKDTIAAIALIIILAILCLETVAAWDKESEAHEQRVAKIIEGLGR